MYMKSIGGLASLGLIAFIVFGWMNSDEPHIPAKLVKSNSSTFGMEKLSASEPKQAAMPELKLDETQIIRTPSPDTAAAYQSASAGLALAVPEVGSAAYEQMSKRDLYGQKVIAEAPVPVNPPPTKESPEFAATMAVKNAEMNSQYGKQAAKVRLQPTAQPTEPPSNRKAPI
jgi:hypothetical protein